MTNKLPYDKETDPPSFDRDGKCGWLEETSSPAPMADYGTSCASTA